MGQTTDFIEFTDSQTAVAPAGRLRFRLHGGVAQQSVDGGAWSTIGGGGGGGSVNSVAATAAGLLAVAGTASDPTVGMAAAAAGTYVANITGGSAVPTAASRAAVQSDLGIQAANAVAVTGGTIAGVAITTSTLNMGGNSVVGDTASGGNLTFSTSSNATKGAFIFGSTAGWAINETAKTLVYGNIADTSAGAAFYIKKSGAGGQIAAFFNNPNAGTTANIQFSLGTADDSSGPFATWLLEGASFTTNGLYTAGSNILRLFGGTGSLIFQVQQASGDIIFATGGGTGTLRMTILNDGSIKWPVSGKLGAFGAAAVAQQTVGANVNNVAASGTTGQFDDFTSGTVYATDYAALHATVYQLTRSVAQLTAAMRNYGLGV